MTLLLLLLLLRSTPLPVRTPLSAGADDNAADADDAAPPPLPLMPLLARPFRRPERSILRSGMRAVF